MRAYCGLAAAVVLAFAGLAQAGPFDAKEISADAKWAAHLNVDAFHFGNDALLHFVREPLDIVRTGERIDRIGQPHFVGEYLHRA